MKRIILLLSILCCAKIQAQIFPWQAVQPNRAFCYVFGSDKWYLKVDSAQIGNYTSIYWNYFRFENGFNNGVFGGAYFYIDSSDWTGRYIVEHAGSDNEFMGQNGNKFKLEVNRSVGEKWICYDLSGPGFIEARVDTQMSESFLNLTDSVRVISFRATDSSAAGLSHWINSVKLRLSKNYGLLDVIRFGDLEQYSDVHSLVGFTLPETNWPDLTAENIFDIQPGDIRIVKEGFDGSGAPYPSEFTLTRAVCFKRTELNGGNLIVLDDSLQSIQLKYNGALHHFDTLYSTKVVSDTVNLSAYSFLNSLDYEATEKPLYGGNKFLYHTHDLYLVTLPASVRAKYQMEGLFYDNSRHIWPIPFDFPAVFYYFVEFMGGGFYATPSISGGTAYRLPACLKKGSLIWGDMAEWNTLRSLVTARGPQGVGYSLFPNPTQGEVTLQVENTARENVLFTISSLDGKCVLTETLNTSTQSISTAHLLPGMYYYTLQMPDGRSAHGKLCRQ